METLFSSAPAPATVLVFGLWRYCELFFTYGSCKSHVARVNRHTICSFKSSFPMFAVTVGKGPEIFPICTNKPQSDFTVECNIKTEKTKDEKCLLYRHSWGFVRQCDSRFTLPEKNQTVFLRLASLTPVDSGNYTCVCSRPEKTYVLRLNITVEGTFLTDKSKCILLTSEFKS